MKHWSAGSASPSSPIEEPMSQDPDPESVDLATLVVVLRRTCGASVLGAVVGRTRLRDEITRHLDCSLLMAERIVDTMIGRGFIRQQVHRDGWVHWEMDEGTRSARCEVSARR
jgi:hypothetical protein